MSKKPNALANALRSSGAAVAATPPPEPVAAPAETAEASAEKTPGGRVAKRATPLSRTDKAPITVHHPERVRRQLKALAAEQGRTMDDLVAEAFNLVFVKYRKPEIAPRKGGQAA